MVQLAASYGTDPELHNINDHQIDVALQGDR